MTLPSVHSTPVYDDSTIRLQHDCCPIPSTPVHDDTTVCPQHKCQSTPVYNDTSICLSMTCTTIHLFMMTLPSIHSTTVAQSMWHLRENLMWSGSWLRQDAMSMSRTVWVINPSSSYFVNYRNPFPSLGCLQCTLQWSLVCSFQIEYITLSTK